MRFIITALVALTALVAVTPAFAVVAPTATAPPAAPTHQGWWYADKDNDGYCLEAEAVNQDTRPKGMKSRAECAGAPTWDTDDTNRFVSPGAPVVASPTSADKAAWSMGMTLAQADQRTPGFAKVKDQVEACETAIMSWLVYRATCDCGVGYAWRAYEDTEAHEWTGVCDAIHGTSGSGSVDSRARKAAEDNAAALTAHEAKDDAAHAELADGLAATNNRFYGLSEAVADEFKRHNQLVTGLAEGLQSAADALEVEVQARRAGDEAATAKADAAQFSADRARADAEKANRRMEVVENTDHNTVGVALAFGWQTPEDTTSGRVLKPSSFVGPSLNYSGFGAPIKAVPNFIVGGDLVGVWFVGQQGLGAMPSIMAGYDNGRFLATGLAGGWVETSSTFGRRAQVVSYGGDLGVRLGFRPVKGLVVDGRFIQSVFGADSVRNGAEQCVYDGGVTLLTLGAGFSF